MSELEEIKAKAKYNQSKCGWDQSEIKDLYELIIRLTDELIKEKQNRLNGEQS